MPDPRAQLEARLQELNETGADTPEKVSVLLDLAEEVSFSDPARAEHLIDEAHTLAVRLDDRAGIGGVKALQGAVAFFRSEFETALTLAREALTLLDDAAPTYRARCLALIAQVYLSLGDFDEAFQYGQEALQIFRAQGSQEQEAWVLHGFGTAYHEIGDYDRAMHYYEASYQLFQEIDHPVGLARALNGIGTAHHALGRLEEALAPLHESLTGFRAADNPVGVSRAQNDLGRLYMDLGQTDDALTALHESLHLREDLNNRQALCTTLIDLGRLYLQLDRIDDAEAVLQRALDTAQAIKSKLRQYQAHEVFVQVAERQGNLRRALAHFRQFHAIREEVFGDESRARMRTMEIRLAVQKAEQDADIARLRNVELKEKNEQLEALLDELHAAQAQLIQSEKMASLGQLTAGIAHEIKNPLNFVTNFALLASELVDDLRALMTDDAAHHRDEIDEILNDLQQSVTKIHEHGERADGIVRSMLLHSRGDPRERRPTDVNALIEEYVNLAYHGMRAQEAGFNASLHHELDPEVGTHDVIPQELGRVLINLLNNAFFAVYERAQDGEDGYAPTVTIRSQARADGFEIQIVDNGTGIPKAILPRIFEPFFTTKPTGNGTGLGLSLSYDIIKQGHGGTLTADSTEGVGTTFTIRI